MSLRLLTYNIRMGGANRERAISHVINSCLPDIVLLEEATRPDVVQKLAELCGMKTFGAMRGHSLAFLSKIDIAHHAWHQVRFAKRRYLELLLDGTSTRIFGVHLAAVHSNLMERRRAYELRALLRSIAQRDPGFHLVAGDFNTLAPGEDLDVGRLPARLRAFLWITGGKVRWTTIRLMLDAGYADTFRIFHKDVEGFTFPTWDPHVRLDYIFVPAVSAPRITRCEIVQNVAGIRDASDHFPLLCEFTLPQL